MTGFRQILFSEQDIANKVGELAARISRDYAGREPVLVCILKGAALFTADLARGLSVPATVEFVQASSYGAGTTPSRTVAIEKDLPIGIMGRDVLLVDTIVDTGRTLDVLVGKFRERRPASLEVVALLDKRSRRRVDIPIAYRGFEIPDLFVVGYGMDYDQRYRNLPCIAVMEAGPGSGSRGR